MWLLCWIRRVMGRRTEVLYSPVYQRVVKAEVNLFTGYTHIHTHIVSVIWLQGIAEEYVLMSLNCCPSLILNHSFFPVRKTSVFFCWVFFTVRLPLLAVFAGTNGNFTQSTAHRLCFENGLGYKMFFPLMLPSVHYHCHCYLC